MLAIVAGLIGLLDKAGQYALVVKLREHSDALLNNQKALDAANAAFMNNTDQRDDLEYVELIKEKARLEAALLNEINLAQVVKA